MANPFMEYLPPVSQQRAPQPQPGGAGKYHGAIAEDYDAKREQSPKWVLEQRVIEGMLSDLPAGTVVLDCPVGTGRFLGFYTAKGFSFIGADLSGDMLVQAALKLLPETEVEKWVAACNKANVIMRLHVKGRGSLVNADIRQIGLEDKSVDVAVACRITRWLSPHDCVRALKELQRVARHGIIFTARVRNHVHARSYELIQSALEGWKIHRDETGVDLDYRIIELRPA